jgi:membrane-associated phospholipid phosphatase
MLVWLVLVVVVLVPGAIAAKISAAFHRRRGVRHGPVHGSARAIQRELHRHSALVAFVRDRARVWESTGLLLTLAVIAIVGVGVLAFQVRSASPVVSTDGSVAQWASRHSTEAATAVLEITTDLGGTVVVVVASLAVVVLSSRRGGAGRVALFLVATIGGAKVLTNVLKEVVERARPDIDQLVTATGFSYPSGHSSAVAVSAAALALCMGRGRSPATRTWLAAIGAAIVGMVAASRVLLGVHWLSDVVAGVALGGAWFALCAIAFGGRLLRFGAPVEMAARAEVMDRSSSQVHADDDGRRAERDPDGHVGEVVHAEHQSRERDDDGGRQGEHHGERSSPAPVRVQPEHHGQDAIEHHGRGDMP